MKKPVYILAIVVAYSAYERFQITGLSHNKD